MDAADRILRELLDVKVMSEEDLIRLGRRAEKAGFFLSANFLSDELYRRDDIISNSLN